MKLTQQQIILKLLKDSPNGVNSYDLTFIHSIKQAPTRVRELKEKGYLIKSSRNRNASVTYHLLGEVSKNAPEVTTVSKRGIVDEIREGMDNQVRVWSEKLQRYVYEDRREVEQMQI